MNTGSAILYALLIITPAMLLVLLNKKNSSFTLFKNMYLLSSSLVLIMTVLLFGYLLTDDFRYAYIYSNSSVETGIPYKISAFWAGSEGSFLLWLILIKISVLMFIKTYGKISDRIPFIAIILIEFSLLVLLLIKNPFMFIWDKMPDSISPGQIPQNGTGMNPLLMDPWMIMHPPVLFMGYATAVIPFGLALSALIRKNADQWIKTAFPWIIVSAVTLGTGIFMGGYWSYKVLGWGGFWGWDPVENSSLVPWIVSVILIHGIIIQKRRGAFKKTNLLFSLLYFVLIYYSTFLTKSGILSDFSVHSFGKTDIANALGIIFIFFVLSTAVIFAKGFKNINSAKISDNFLSQDNSSIYGMISFTAYAIIILIGTSLPIITSLSGNGISVTESFYNRLSIPLGIIIIFSLIITEYSIKKFRIKALLLFILPAIAITVFISVYIKFSLTDSIYYLICLFLILVTSSQLHRKAMLAKNLSHMGIAIFVFGVILSSSIQWSEKITVTKGSKSSAGNIQIKLSGYREGNASSILINFIKDNRSVSAELPYYIESKGGTLYREPYIYSCIAGDYYVIPESYNFSELSYSTGIIQEGHTHSISDYRVKFLKFIIHKMNANSMSLSALLEINGKKYSPSVSFDAAGRKDMDVKMAGTGQTVSLKSIDAKSRAVEIYISPKKNITLPPDSAVFTVSFKPLIWMVWLGTLLITAGLALSLFKEAGKHRENE